MATNDTVPPFNDDYLIHRLYVMMRLFTKTLNDSISPYGLYSSEWTVLNYLIHHDGLLQADIAAALEIEPAAISKTLSKMEKKGLITKSFQQDKREKYISLTPAAKELFPTLAEAVRTHRHTALNTVPEEHLRLMLQTICTMTDNLK